jgi:large subunit ribosomal protein L29
MKYSDLKDQAVVELKKKKVAAVEELTFAKMKNSLGQMGNPLEIRRMRRDLARINTALTQHAKQG